jgi:hypothetical protein
MKYLPRRRNKETKRSTKGLFSLAGPTITMVTDSSLLVVWAILHIWVHCSVLYFYLFFILPY